MTTAPAKAWHRLRRSPIHGTGVYAARKIPAGTRVFEYTGEIISSDEADRRHPVNPDDPFHTFFFALGNGTVIDGHVGGNEAKWVNHSCEPNCETEETDDFRVYIVALRDIERGEELNFDYGLVLDERLTKTVREQYKCLCGMPGCRGTMLALKRKPAASPRKAKAVKKPASKSKAAKPADSARPARAKDAAVKATGKTPTPVKKKVGTKSKDKAATTPGTPPRQKTSASSDAPPARRGRKAGAAAR